MVRLTKEQRSKFAHWNYAHRGLHTPDHSVPENSLPAFRAAAECGYGVELDVQLTKDGRVVVFHDENLKRGCGRDGQIGDYTFEELQQFPLFDTDCRIPLFS
ncbi:MAG: glycerophosphodiester phosphodiesterase, partial [Lachnospiraceae bacterium]|nr:glycerophosphodiester phosphodiesterase [Lachnospiraceae bacterium]